MISIDLLLILLAMSLLFLRHISIYKDPSKINYTPMVLALGLIGGLLHYVLSDSMDPTVIKESLLSLSVGILLSAIMSVMNQNFSVTNAHEERRQIQKIAEDVAELAALKERLDLITRMEDSTHDQIRHVFKEEIDALNVIQSNQNLFLSKIESLLSQQQNAMGKFEELTFTELPSLDNVVHRHIDMLRIAEQDHFVQLKNAARNTQEEQKELHTQIREIHELLHRNAQHQLPDHTLNVLQKELSRIVSDFSHHLQMIGAKSETIITSLLENDSLLKGVREESELIMQQMVLSSKQMREMSVHAKELSDSLKPLSHLFDSAQTLHEEFLRSKGKLSELIVTLESYEHQEFRAVRHTLEQVAAEATAQMQLLSQTLQKRDLHHQETNPLIEARNVQELASKVKLHRSYLGENQE